MVKECLSRMSGKLSRTVLRRGKGSNPFSLVDYTSISFRQLLKDKELRQSMSRRGNCWDIAPQESFFGHMKDEIHLEMCYSFADLNLEIDDYMDYYNNDRYQWRLAELSPYRYANYLKTGEYPIKI
jgi:putative transposase